MGGVWSYTEFHVTSQRTQHNNHNIDLENLNNNTMDIPSGDITRGCTPSGDFTGSYRPSGDVTSSYTPSRFKNIFLRHGCKIGIVTIV